jgi:type II secretory pathway pseudopilin PulG
MRTNASKRSGAAGFTLIEVMIAGLVLTVAAVGMSGAILSSMALQRGEIETALARQAARRVVEEMRGTPFADVYRAYNADAGDDAGLALPAQGAGFDVFGLTPQAGDPDGRCGRVMFPTLVVGASEDLVEDIDEPALGMPLDLNRDGVLDLLDHADDYVVLPVRVRVEWRGLVGAQRYDLETILVAP